MSKRNKFGFATAVAGLALVVGGIVAPTMASASGVEVTTLPLHNNTAAVESDCPDTVNDYWHFVIAPNQGYEFVTITLTYLVDGGPGTATSTFGIGSGIVPNGTQYDNVFVQVPANSSLTGLLTSGSSSTITPHVEGDKLPKFNLSHLCDGTPAPTTTTEAPTTTTEAPTTTTEAPTTTTEAPTTTTEAPTTTTEAPTTTVAPTTVPPTTLAPTTTIADTTTTVASEGPTTTVAETTTTQVGSEGPTTTVDSQSGGPTTTALSAVPGLPRTGSSQSALIVLGLLMIIGGVLFIALSRRFDEA